MAFQSCPEQHGLMVTIGSEIVGLEILPNERTYKVLHQKLLARYAAMTLVNVLLPRGLIPRGSASCVTEPQSLAERQTAVTQSLVRSGADIRLWCFTRVISASMEPGIQSLKPARC